MSSQILKSATVTGAGNGYQLSADRPQFTVSSFQAVGVMSAGAGTAVVAIEVSNNGVNYFTLGTITLTLSTTPATDGFAVQVPYDYVRANATTLTANGTVSVYMKE